uniref:Uncharacterized protein n=1 Tax=Cacopsylla melanoneura TaxID=428564 RepID=A0A8D8Q0E8_9HEMI
MAKPCFLTLFLASLVTSVCSTTARRQDRPTDNVVVIFGNRQKENEDIKLTVDEIGHRLGIENPLSDVRKVYRSKVRKLSPKPIVIFLKNKTVRDRWNIAYHQMAYERDWWAGLLLKHIWVVKDEEPTEKTSWEIYNSY